MSGKGQGLQGSTTSGSGRSLLFVVSTLEVGGSESKVVKIANALARAGSQVEIAYLSAPETLRDRVDACVPVTHLGRRGRFSASALIQLRKLATRGHVLIAAVNLYPMLYVVPAAARLDSRGVRTACLVNMVDIAGRDRRFERLYGWLLGRCDRVIFGYETQRGVWSSRYALEAQRTGFIYNGVDEQFFSADQVREESLAFRRSLAIPNDTVVLGSVGRLSPEKAYDLLVLALAELRRRGFRCCVVLAGQGSERQRLENLAVRHGVKDDIHFLGLVRDVRPVLGMLDVFIMPSSSETFSNAVLEAMAMSRAVVMSDTGGTLEMVEHRRSGLVFRSGDLAALVAALSQLVESEEGRRRLGAEARERVLERFRFSQMVDSYRQLMVE